jgi:hypothetical protein
MNYEMVDLRGTADLDKLKVTQKLMEEQNGPKEELNENIINGLPK